jgi:hypothetical protein
VVGDGLSCEGCGVVWHQRAAMHHSIPIVGRFVLAINVPSSQGYSREAHGDLLSGAWPDLFYPGEYSWRTKSDDVA